MTAHPGAVPVLTEVIEVVPEPAVAPEPLPLAPDSVPLDAAAPVRRPVEPAIPRLSLWGEADAQRVVDDMVARLQPMVQAWIAERLAEGLQQSLQDTVRQSVQAALAEALASAVDTAVRQGTEQAGAELARRLRDELPILARAALEASRPDPFGG